MIDIWCPRYHDRVVLVACCKVRRGDNAIRFTKAKHLKGHTFNLDGAYMKSCPQESNGVIPCYAVPLSKFEEQMGKGE